MENKFNWFRCRKCNKPLLKLTDTSIVVNEIYCRCCKTSFNVNIQKGRVLEVIEIPKENK